MGAEFNRNECDTQMDCFPSIEHCEFIWTIENISSCQREGDNSNLISPIFATGVQSPYRWYLKLRPNTPNEVSNNTNLHLYRSRDDRGPKKVRVTCKLSYKSGNRCILVEELFQVSFKRGSNYNATLKPFDCVLKEIAEKGSSQDTFTIACEMFLYMNKKTVQDCVLPPINPDLQQLSKDLLSLFLNRPFADVEVKCAEDSVKAHGVVLAARSSVFKSLLLRNCSEKPVIAINMPKIAVEKVLLYIYSGRLDISAQDMHLMFGIQSCAEKYELLHLTEAFVPDRITARTVIQVERCELNWRVDDLTCPEEGYIQSPFFGICSRIGENWFLRLSIQISDNMHSEVSCKAGVENLSKSVYLRLEVSIENEVGTFKKTFETTSSLDADAVMSLNSPSSEVQEEIPNFLAKSDVLVVRCIMRLCGTKPHAGNIEKLQTCSETSNPLRTSLMELSKDLLGIHGTGHFCDRMLRVGTRAMRVHRTILSARSPVFADMFQALEESERPSGELAVPGLTPDILKKMIKYIYSGQFSASSFNEAEALYDAMDRYCVPVIKFLPPS